MTGYTDTKLYNNTQAHAISCQDDSILTSKRCWWNLHCCSWCV